MIEYTHIMSNRELSDFFSSIIDKGKSKKSIAVDLLIRNKEKLLDDHFQFEQERVAQYYIERRNLLDLQSHWRKKTCPGCSTKMRIVFDQFWGCPNYKDESNTHKTFALNYDEYLIDRFKNHNVRIDANWVTTILRKNNLQPSVSATDLLDFFEGLGMDDLREKYGYKKSKERISGYVRAKKESIKEEKEITEHLKKFFLKSNTQTGIRYKLTDQIEKVAIVDLIVSTSKHVYVIEIKRSPLDLKEEQLKLYQQLIEHTLKQSKDNRICKSLFIVYNNIKIYYPIEFKYLLFESIKDIDSEKAILLEMNKSIFTNGF